MKEIVAALLLAHYGKPVTRDHQTNIENAIPLIGDINVSDGEKWVKLFSAEQLRKLLEDGAPLKVGDKVLADYKGDIKDGVIKTIGYQIDGFGNKYYSEEDIQRL